jgi:hypothetical protein
MLAGLDWRAGQQTVVKAWIQQAGSFAGGVRQTLIDVGQQVGLGVVTVPVGERAAGQQVDAQRQRYEYQVVPFEVQILFPPWLMTARGQMIKTLE